MPVGNIYAIRCVDTDRYCIDTYMCRYVDIAWGGDRTMQTMNGGAKWSHLELTSWRWHQTNNTLRLFCSSPCLLDDSSLTWQPPPLCLSLWSEQAAWPPTLIRSSHQPPQNVFIMRPVLVAEAVTSSSTRLATVAGSRAGKLRLIRFSGTRHLVSFSNCVEVLEKEEVRSRSRDVNSLIVAHHWATLQQGGTNVIMPMVHTLLPG